MRIGPQVGGITRRAVGARAPRKAAMVAALLGAFALARPALAQGAGNGFLFTEPRGSFELRGGFAHANAGSDIFSFTTNELTIDRRDFSGFTIDGDLGFRIAPRFDVVVGGSYAGTRTPSEFRDFVDQNDLPIQQTTTFQRAPLTASVKAYLTPRGRSIGHYAWVPSKLAVYVGGGGGAMWYRFRQRGDFVDFETNEVFSDQFESSGWTPEAHAMAGFDLSLTPRFALTTQGRYSWAKATPDEDFSGFRKIDLSGFAVTAGLAVRF
jgi:hypothetical protein